MFPKLRCIILVLISVGIFTKPTMAMGFITPNNEVLKLARSLAYKDFPRASDILTIIRIESGFNPLAINSVSNGIMQVNHAPFDVTENMRRGVALLREYYLMTKSIEGAVKSYNVGIGNYLNNIMPAAAADYWSKFSSQLKAYENYEASYHPILRLSIECLGCIGTSILLIKKTYTCRKLEINYLSNY
jgi:hypothetical protein